MLKFHFMYDRMMYWTNRRHLGARIERASMNGENRMALINTRIRNPTGLAIDYYRNDRVYWSDTKENTIESCSFDGKDRTTIVSKGMFEKFSALFKDKKVDIE